MKGSVTTIGHSNHQIERFIQLLVKNGVTAVADVRSQPFSRMHPQFNRDPLRATLTQAGIAYVFLGKELGARSMDPSCYVNDRVSYERLAETTLFGQGLERILTGCEEHQIALLCAEKEPLVCHRAILVARHLHAQGLEVGHILADGKVEMHESAIQRLLREVGLDQPSMLESRESQIAEAYRIRGEEIAYRRTDRGSAGYETIPEVGE